jgi:antitoxin CptB
VVARLYDTALMSEPHSPPLDARRRRLLFRATHRGTFENDLMLGGFLRAHLATLDDADLTALEALLELPDPDLADWLTGRAPVPPEQDTAMLRRIRAAVAQ